MTWFLPKPWRWTDPSGYMWHDAGAQQNNEGWYASGLPLETPGVAFPNAHGTLGGWWHVEFPKWNVLATVRQVDVGPPNVVDLSAPLGFLVFGSNPNKIDNTPWDAVYLGRVLPEGRAEGIIRS